MTNLFQKYKVIVVAGPRGSGTEAASKAIAKKLEYSFVPEGYIRFDNVGLFKKYVHSGQKLVIQAPGLSYMVHRMPNKCLVVFMRRILGEVIAYEQEELPIKEMCHYEREFDIDPDQFEEGYLAETVYQVWDREQKPKMTGQFLEMRYQDLQSGKWIGQEEKVEGSQESPRLDGITFI
jgi:hypothetical protein